MLALGSGRQFPVYNASCGNYYVGGQYHYDTDAYSFGGTAPNPAGAVFYEARRATSNSSLSPAVLTAFLRESMFRANFAPAGTYNIRGQTYRHYTGAGDVDSINVGSGTIYGVRLLHSIGTTGAVTVVNSLATPGLMAQVVQTEWLSAGSSTITGSVTDQWINGPVIPSGSTYVFTGPYINQMLRTVAPPSGCVFPALGSSHSTATTVTSNVTLLWSYRSGLKSGAVQNAGFWLDTDSATCGNGIVGGASMDTCLYRARAGAWTGPAGTDIYTDFGSLCAGTGCAALSSSAVGVYQAGVQVLDTLIAGTGIIITGSGNSRTIAATGTAGVTSLAGTAGQISASASTGAITISLPNPVQPAQSAPTLASLGAAAGTGGGASISNLVGTNNAFFFDLTTGSAPISAGGVIATFTWSSSWNVALNANGPACTAHIANAEGVADPAGYMSTYGPKLYAIPTSGSVATSLQFKIATGASAVALPVVTTVKMLIRCDMAR